MNPHLYGLLIYPRICNGEKAASSVKGVQGNLDSYMQKKIKLDYFLKPCTKINSKWIKDLNVRPKIIKILEENICSMLFDIGLCNIFFGSVSSGKGKKGKINKWNYIKLKSFCPVKEAINKLKSSPTE